MSQIKHHQFIPKAFDNDKKMAELIKNKNGGGVNWIFLFF